MDKKVEEQIKELLQEEMQTTAMEVSRLQQAGSDRVYYRVVAADRSYVATYGNNVPENEAFIYLSKHFATKKLPVPQIYAVSADKHIYIQEDFGNEALLAVLEREGHTEKVKDLYKQSLVELARLQVQGQEELDYERCLTSTTFGKEAILADLLYFKYYFLDILKFPYDKQKLLQDFDRFATFLDSEDNLYFMFRDFQSRNIMIRPDARVGFIDYQGGMKGAPQYDLASLLWQAKANLSQGWKDELVQAYLEALKKYSDKPIIDEDFLGRYSGYILIRLLQVLGAYGFRGLFEQKAHFLTSIPLALQNLQQYLTGKKLPEEYSELNRILAHCISEETLAKFTTIKAGKDARLQVTINSFSYLKNGYPQDATDHGGGFVFDCRGILNPGREEAYKRLSGEDESVQNYLEQETEMLSFLKSVYNLIDISIENYLGRNFDSLSINFGCTGGQHRSVYAANAVARHLRNKFGLQPAVQHLNKANWKTK